MNQVLSPEKFLQILSHYLLDTIEGFIVIDAEDQNKSIVYANRGFTKMTGYSAEEIIGKEINILLGAESSSEDIESINDAIANYKKSSFSLLAYKKDGSSFWSLCSFSPIYNSAGIVTHFSITLNNVTAQREYVKQKSEYDSMKSTLETVNDILFNYMNFLQGFGSDLEEILSKNKNGDTETLLKDFRDEYTSAVNKLLALNDIKEYKVKKLGGRLDLLDINSKE